MGIVGGFGADVFDPPLPLVAEEVEAKAVLRGCDLGEEVGAEADPLGGVDEALEDGILDALPAIFAQAGNAAQTAAAGFFACADVVADEDEHRLLPPEEGGVGVEATADVAGEQECLGVGDEAERDALVEEGMLDLFLLARLPGGDDQLAGGFFEEGGAAVLGGEAGGLDLAAVDEGEGEAVGEGRAELFHEVECEAGAAGAVGVEEADGGIEADAFEGRFDVVAEEGVEEAEQGVGAVEGRAAGTGLKAEGFAVGVDHGIEGGEVFLCSEAFVPAGGFDAVGARGVEADPLEALGGAAEGFAALRVGGLASSAQQDGAAVGDLGGDDHADGRQGAGGPVAEPVLLAAQQHVAGDGALHAGEKAAVLGEEGDADAALAAERQHGRRAGDLAPADEAFEGVHGDAETGLAVHLDGDGLAVAMEVGARRHDVERVQELSHGSSSSLRRD